MRALKIAAACAEIVKERERTSAPIVIKEHDGVTVVSISNQPIKFPKRVIVDRDEHPIFETPAGVVVKELLIHVRAIQEKLGWRRFNVCSLSPKKGETQSEWIDRCVSVVAAWRLSHLRGRRV